MNQTIPITLTAGPVAPGTQAADLNQLMQLICQVIAGAIRADVSFIAILLNDPTTYQGQLIFNQTQNVFKSWSTTDGMYIALTQYAVGDVKFSTSGADTVQTGWVVANGRDIDAIPGLTQNQIDNLDVLYPDGLLTTITAPASTVGTLYPLLFAGLPS